ncbi:MAG: bifunctional adenosylcobinamide kinase/adenosylcobinamide-phosphate guanylyltransferase [Nitrosomonas sp.]|nr:bifunctional adenosylcobinamide kinase/adenosylcobinamide-phosphate guanylyltransferase [Nitrosomonas sp.]MDP1950229.1 bifunctional adenosylcobinamide kinase/adenosylcobinamide-phosphate guanylyltransferase [Nitrosomonas sp.]
MINLQTLILGGVRSGKSRLAERLALDSKLPVTYIATATAQDKEMHQRIALHRAHRPEHWHVIEEPIKLGAAISKQALNGHCILVDCLTLWLTNLLIAENESFFEHERKAFFTALPTVTNRIIFVSNETNMGVTPMGELSRRYCDEVGQLHQALAQHCDQVILTVAGLPHVLKGERL